MSVKELKEELEMFPEHYEVVIKLREQEYDIDEVRQSSFLSNKMVALIIED